MNSFIAVIFVGKKSLDRQWIGPRLVWDKYLSTRSVLDRQTNQLYYLKTVIFFQQTYIDLTPTLEQFEDVQKFSLMAKIVTLNLRQSCAMRHPTERA